MAAKFSPSRGFKVQAVGLIINGSMGAAALAKKLKVSVKDLQEWRRLYGGEVKRQKLSAKEEERALKKLKEQSATTDSGTKAVSWRAMAMTADESSSSSAAPPPPSGSSSSSGGDESSQSNQSSQSSGGGESSASSQSEQSDLSSLSSGGNSSATDESSQSSQSSSSQSSSSSSSESSSSSSEGKTVLLFGYWPPTDIGVSSRHGMLWKWQNLQNNYKNSGYDVLAITPTFTNSLGTVSDGTPYWGKGTGQLKVDFKATATDFWNIVKQYKPAAILSFSRAYNDKAWTLEETGWNNQNNAWTPLSIPYTDQNGNPQTDYWDPPYIGGNSDDPSPYKNQGPISLNPPDPTLAANSTRSGYSDPLKSSIITALQSQFPNPPGNLVPGSNSSQSFIGKFVSAYMAYLVAWYREYSKTIYPANRQCLYSGHTHVGIEVVASDGETAVDIHLDKLFELLP